MDDATVMDKFCCKLEKKKTVSYLLYPLFIHRSCIIYNVATTDQYLLLGDLALFCGKWDGISCGLCSSHYSNIFEVA